MAIFSSFTFRSKAKMVFLPESLSRPGSQLSSASLSPTSSPLQTCSQNLPPPQPHGPLQASPPAPHLCSSPISHLPTRVQLLHQITSAPAHGAQASWFSLSNTRIKYLTHQSSCKVCLQGFVSAQGHGLPPHVPRGGEALQADQLGHIHGRCFVCWLPDARLSVWVKQPVGGSVS